MRCAVSPRAPVIVLALMALLGRAASADTIVGLNITNGLLVMSGSAPIAVSAVIPITGLEANTSVAAMDVRSSTGVLYALVTQSFSSARLYTINVLSGVATAVGASFPLPQVSGTSLVPDYAMDYDAALDQFRVVSLGRDNFRVSPTTGVPTAVTALSAGANVEEIASFKGTLYGIDPQTDQLVRIGGVGGSPTPDLGAVTPIGPLGVDTGFVVGFDVSETGIAYVALTTGVSRLYTVNLATGAVTQIGAIPGGTAMRAIAVLSSRGDVNGDGRVNVTDVLYLINFLFAGGSPPPP